MPYHKEEQIVFHPIRDVFNLVANVKNYPTFLPGIISTTVYPHSLTKFHADVSVGYGFSSFLYRSWVLLHPYEKIIISSQDGPFKKLESQWCFKEISLKKTLVLFEINYSFKGRLFQIIMNKAFDQLLKQTIKSFQEELEKI